MRYKKFSIDHLKRVLDELGVTERELCKRLKGKDTHARLQEIFTPKFGHQTLIDLANVLDMPIDTFLETQEQKSDIPNINGNYNNINSTVINNDIATLKSENESLKMLIKEKDLRIEDLKRNFDTVINLAQVKLTSDE